jgi:NAD(P)H dehydrogenase (quinone)
MGGVSAEFAKFKDWTSKRWMEGKWRDKLAAGFTSSARAFSQKRESRGIPKGEEE